MQQNGEQNIRIRLPVLRQLAQVFEQLRKNPINPTPICQRQIAQRMRAGLTAIGHDYADTITDPKIRALFRVMIAEVPRFPELGQELYEKGKKPYLDRLHAYLEAEVAAGHLAITNVPLAARQFLGMINDVILWPHMLIVGLQESPADVGCVVEGAVETMLRAFSRSATIEKAS